MTETITGIHHGQLEVDGVVTVRGTVTGDIHVSAGGKLLLRGTGSADLVVDEGGMAEITGMLTGAVRNAGAVFVAVGAMVRHRVLSPAGVWVQPEGGYHVTDATPRFQLGSDGSLSPV